MIGITTIPKPQDEIVKKAEERAKELNLPFYERVNSCNECIKKNNLEGLIVYGKEPFFKSGEEEYYFNIGTGKLRLLQLKRGNEDRLCRLIPKTVNTFLDCTFGQGHDSMVVSWFLGDSCKITALEKSKVLYEIGKYGIENFNGNKDIQKALKRIKLKNEDFLQYLKKSETKSIDVIYFDTMFKHPVKPDKNRIEGFRKIACYDTLTNEVFEEALRVAKKRIIVKERPFSSIFKKYKFTYIDSKKGKTVAYGVIET